MVVGNEIAWLHYEHYDGALSYFGGLGNTLYDEYSATSS
jgi:hypothetical protein